MESQWVIYGLRLKTDDEYRYVGLTRFGASQRLSGHIREAEYGRLHYPVYAWIRKHGSYAIQSDVLEVIEVGNDTKLKFREQFWIATFKSQFSMGIKKKRLLNLNDGGNSCIGGGWERMDPDKRELRRRKASEAMSKRMTGFNQWANMDPKKKEARIARLKEVEFSEERRRKISESALERSLHGNLRKNSKYGAHIKWHVNRSMINSECEFCE